MDMTAITLVVGAALAVVPGWAGWLAGRASGRAEARRDTTASGLVCSCGHGYGTHSDEARCHGTDVRKRNGLQQLDPCPCRRYDGPEPLPKVWSPTTAPREDIR